MDDDGSTSMIAMGLAELSKAANLEGAAVLDLSNEPAGPMLLYECGLGAADVQETAGALLYRERQRASHGFAPDYRPVLVCPWTLPVRRFGGLVMWRPPGARGWGAASHVLAASAGGLVRTMLEHEPGDVGLDRLTGLPNRGYFLEQVERHIERLDLDGASGTMMVVDLDGLERLNREYGRALGDRMLARTGTMLRAMVRPADPVARVGPDEFAVWLDGMDHMTAAERADMLSQRRLSMADWDGRDPVTAQTLSIGIATRRPGSGEEAVTLLRRAQMAMREVKLTGGRGWRVSHVARLG